MIKLEFFSKQFEVITPTIEGVFIDTNSVEYNTEIGKGESTASFDVFCEDHNQLVIEFFNDSVYGVNIYYGTDLVWVGIKSDTRPKFSETQSKLRVEFDGYYVQLDRIKISKVWVDNQATERLVSPSEIDLVNRSIKARQLEGKQTIDGGQIETIMVSDDFLLYHSEERFVLQYKTTNGDFIQAIQGGVLGFRSGQFVMARFYNYDYGVLVKQIDYFDTGDQETLKNYTLLYTPITGGDTERIEYVMGTSPTATATTYTNGQPSDTDENTDTLQASDNCLIIRFTKTFTTAINKAEIWLNANGDYRAKAAIYDNGGNKVLEFYNEVKLSATNGLTKYTFIYNGGMNIGVTTGVVYYLVIRVDNAGADVDITTQGKTSGATPTGYPVGGYLRHGTLASSYDNFSGTFTENTLFNTTWVKFFFEVDALLQNFYDQNDKLLLSQLTVFTKYAPNHSAYTSPSYTAIELIEDALLVGGGEIQFDATLIPADINGGLPFDAMGEINSISTAQALEKIYKVYDAGVLYPQVWAYSHGGTPKLELVLRDESVPPTGEPILGIAYQNPTVILDLNPATEIINFITLKYRDEQGVDRIASPNEYPQLADGDPASLGLDRRDYFYDAGEVSLDQALSIGVGLLAEFSKKRQSGRITITGPEAITSFPSQLGYPPAKVKAMDKFVLIGFIADDGTPDPVYQITKSTYTVGNGELVIEFGDKNFSSDVFDRIKKRVGSNK